MGEKYAKLSGENEAEAKQYLNTFPKMLRTS